MYVKTWLPSNPQQQLIYSIIHLVRANIANFQYAIRKKIASILFESATCCTTDHGCAIENESRLQNTVVSRFHNSTAIS